MQCRFRPGSFRLTSSCAAILLFTCLGITKLPIAHADDGIFPPAPAVKKFMDFDGRGFLLNGQRTFIASGSLHYSRVPRALWHDRLLRMKRAGLNTVQTYAFWNFHEPQEGKWDFSGDHDFNAFLQEVKAVGMYAVVRPGPYVCAEWDSGGYPVWLRFKPGVRVREDNPQFEAAVDHWYEKIIPIIAANQIQRGGPVIMVQLENEHPQGWGRDMPNGYFRHLRDTALRLGLQVPYFFSGLHHGSDPGGDNPWDSKGRTNPWYSTEFWPGWYNLYGPLNDKDLRRFDRGTWKIIAYGGNGYNYYMLHGGTDFDTWNDDEVASSYDYSGAIGQAGDLRPVYYRFKRAAWFARSFQSVLEDSENATGDYKDAATGQGLRITARRSPAGTILFLDNNGNDSITTQVKLGNAQYPSTGSLTINAGEIVPIVTNYKLLPDVTLDLAAARILGISEQGNTTTLVVYGQPDSAGELRFQVPANRVITSPGAQLGPVDATTGRRLLTFNLRFPANGQIENSFTVGNHQVRLLSVSDTTADHTWFVETGGKNYVICGPDYVGDILPQNRGGLRFITERAAPRIAVADTEAMQNMVSAATDVNLPAATIYTPSAGAVPLFPARSSAQGDNMPSTFYGSILNNAVWEMRRGDAEAQINYNAQSWKVSDTPLPMGADGDTGAYAWYRTIVRAPKAGTYSLNFNDVGDWISVFINGQHIGNSKVKQRFNKPVPRTMQVPLNQGDNTLAVLTAHYGRHKLFSYLGPIDTIDAKGVNGTVTLSIAPPAAANSTNIKWRWRADDRGEAAAAEIADPQLNTNSSDWKIATPPGEDVFHERKGFVWYRAELGAVPGPHRTLHFDSVDDTATVFLNGKKLLRH
ncbi:MAG: beta-galactosidase, partial [Abitibacteriaceae bacterium]|nr:beta-galactosidase [Abditibacteriaceae bacterium]